MNLNQKIQDLLSATDLPVEQDEYDKRSSDKYIVFTYADETPTTFGDDCVESDTAYLQIQLITPKNFNYFSLKKQIRDLLEGADFIVTSTRSFLSTGLTGIQRIRQTVFEVTYTEQRSQEE